MVEGISTMAVWASELGRFDLAKVGQGVTTFWSAKLGETNLRGWVDYELIREGLGGELIGLPNSTNRARYKFMWRICLMGQTVDGSFRKNCSL
ncbi:hypothetical protein QQG55_20885 [Brugia pahangi]